MAKMTIVEAEPIAPVKPEKIILELDPSEAASVFAVLGAIGGSGNFSGPDLHDVTYAVYKALAEDPFIYKYGIEIYNRMKFAGHESFPCGGVRIPKVLVN